MNGETLGQRALTFLFRSVTSEWEVALEERPSRFFNSQLIALCVMSVVVLLLPLDGRRIVVSGILVSVVVAQTLIKRLVPPQYFDGSILWVSVAGALLCATVIPNLVPAAAVVILGIATTAVRDIGRTCHLITLLAAVWLGIVTSITPTPNAYLAVLAMALNAPSLIEYAVWLASRDEIQRLRQQMLSNSGHALNWEYSPGEKRLLAIKGPLGELLGLTEKEALEWFNGTHFRSGNGGATWEALETESLVDLPHTDGSTKWFRNTAKMRIRADGEQILYGVAIDVTELEQARRREEERAQRDPLTGLANRDGFAHFLESAGNGGRAVLVLDLDRFKDVNDSLGHLIGDKLIASVANRLMTFAAHNLCIARLGGDEFALAVVAADLETVNTTAERLALEIDAALKQPFAVGGAILNTSVSIGIASETDLEWTELLRRSDGAMYAAKRAGEGHRWFDESADAEFVDGVLRRAELQHGLEDQIVLHYQPVYDAGTRDIVSVEALARWEHPEHGLLGPSDFLPLIDAGELAARFDRQVLKNAIEAASTLATGPGDISVAANLRPTSLWRPELLDEIRSLLSAKPRAHGRLVLEVTEGLLDDPERMLPSMKELRTMGVRVALDDFGTGASSLIRLRALPFDFIKIDRSFVSGVPDNPTDTTIVKSTIDLARDLGMRTVAEGVESLTTADTLTQLGCDQLQGWAFAKAMPLDQLIGLLESSKADGETSTRSYS